MYLNKVTTVLSMKSLSACSPIRQFYKTSSRPRPIPSGTRQNISIARVNTYIYRTEVSKTSGNLRIVFPKFASHWAVIVYEANFPCKHGMTYHLTFHECESAQLSPPAGTSREVVFAIMPMEDTPNGMKEVGTTRFSHAERMNIGQAMIKAFGSYHRVFWNFQHFARLYLSVIAEGCGGFDEWTLSQTSNLFLCAFVVTTPVATTNKKIETRKAEEILAQFPNIPGRADEQIILDASDEAITLAQRMAIEDYSKNHPSDVRVERRGPLRDVLDMLKSVVEKGYRWMTR